MSDNPEPTGQRAGLQPWPAAILSLCVSLAACGDSGSSDDANPESAEGAAGASGGRGLEDAAQLQCDAWLSWATRCGMETDYYAECLDGPWAVVRSEYIRASVACLETLSCDEADDSCVGEALMALGIDDQSAAAEDPLFVSCSERVDECNVLDDLCLGTLVYTDEGRAGAQSCLAGPCADLEACLNNPT